MEEPTIVTDDDGQIVNLNDPLDTNNNNQNMQPDGSPGGGIQANVTEQTIIFDNNPLDSSSPQGTKLYEVELSSNNRMWNDHPDLLHDLHRNPEPTSRGEEQSSS